jgi:hypothetical protein
MPMDVMALTDFVWNTVATGTVGNAAYDGIKTLLGAGFTRLAGYRKNKQQAEFGIALQAILESCPELRDRLTQLATGGTGNNSSIITRDITTGNGLVIVGHGNRIG